jgi:leucyl aminopeptidase
MTIMKLSAQAGSLRRLKADCIALLIPEDKENFAREIAKGRKLLRAALDRAVELSQFKGKEGELLSLLTDAKLTAPRLFLVGLGETSKLTLEKFRRAGAAAAKEANSSHIRHMVFMLPLLEGPAARAEVGGAIAEGAVLSLYKFDKYITEKKNRKGSVREITIADPDASRVQEVKKELHRVRITCEAVYMARDLANAPGSEMYPETLAEAAKAAAGRSNFTATVWDEKKIRREGFGGLLGVSSGSTRPPRFIILEYAPEGTAREPFVLVGKGVTFDSGGISIKPASGMSEMKMDMSGAASVIGAIEAAARLKLPVHLVGLIPATENMPGGSSMRPGDILTHYGGKTSEVDNTDAEGRLILADALAYAVKHYTALGIIDLATLTGACVVALGQHATGMMGTDEDLMAKLTQAGEKTFDRVWQLPLFEEYEKLVKSEVADVKNVGGRWAGAITAACFLKKFVGDRKWVHLDIAGTAILEDALPYAPKGGSGAGVRLLVELFRTMK